MLFFLKYNLETSKLSMTSYCSQAENTLANLHLEPTEHLFPWHHQQAQLEQFARLGYDHELTGASCYAEMWLLRFLAKKCHETTSNISE